MPTPSNTSSNGSTGAGAGADTAAVRPTAHAHRRHTSIFGRSALAALTPPSPVTTLLTPQTYPSPTTGGHGSQASPIGHSPVGSASVWSPTTAGGPPSPPPPNFTYKEPKRSQRNVGLGQLYSQGQNLGTLYARDGVPSFTPEARQWILNMTGQCPCFKTIDFEDPQHAGAPGRPGSSYRALSGRKTLELPERWVTDTFVSEFLRSDLSHIFPMVDNVLFQQTIETAYEPFCNPPALKQLNARACVHAFLAFTSSYFNNLRVAYMVDGDECVNEAKILLLSDAMEDSSLETLQTIIMLVSLDTNRQTPKAPN